MGQLQSRYLVTARSLGTGGRDLGRWQTCSGGNVTSESVPDRAPGDEYPSASGGEKTIEPVTIGRNKKLAVDTDALITHLRALVGRDDSIIVTRKPLDSNRNPFGTGTTWTGTLSDVNDGDSDTNQGGEHSTLELTMQPSRIA